MKSAITDPAGCGRVTRQRPQEVESGGSACYGAFDSAENRRDREW